MANIFKFQFLKRIDNYFLLNHPFLWVSRIHYVTFYGLSLLIIFSLIAYLYPIKPNNVPNLQTIFYIFLLPYFIFFISWVESQDKYKENKFFPVKGKTSEFTKLFIYLYITSIFLCSPFIIIESLSFKNLSQEIKKDIKLLNDCSLFLSYSYLKSIQHENITFKYISPNEFKEIGPNFNYFAEQLMNAAEYMALKSTLPDSYTLKSGIFRKSNIFPLDSFIIKMCKLTEKKRNEIMKSIGKFSLGNGVITVLKPFFNKIKIINKFELKDFINKNNEKYNEFNWEIYRIFNIETSNEAETFLLINRSIEKQIENITAIQYHVTRNIKRITAKNIYNIPIFNINIFGIIFVCLFYIPTLILRSRNSSLRFDDRPFINFFFFFSLIILGFFVKINSDAESNEWIIVCIIYFSLILFLYFYSTFVFFKNRKSNLYNGIEEFFLEIFATLTLFVFLVIKSIYSGDIVFSYFWFLAGVLLYIVLLPFIKRKQDKFSSLPEK